MRIIQSFQGGGIPSFVSYTNVPQPQAAAPYMLGETDNTSQAQDNLIDDKMIKFLYENGMPSDVEKFIETSGIFSKNLYSNPFNKDNSLLQYKTLLKILPRLRLENERFKNALEQADKNGGLGEVAVTDTGKVLTVDSDNNVQEKFMSEVDLSQEQLLTNSQLSNYRANNTNAAFNSNLTSVIHNAVGVPKITEYIQSIINKLGTTSMSREGYVGQQSGKVLKGLEYLASLNLNQQDLSSMSVDGLYKASKMEKSQQLQANQALNYIMSTLPKNMRTVLQAKAAMYINDNSQEGVKKLVMQLIGSALNGDYSVEFELQKGLDATGNTKSSSGGSDNNIIDPAKAFLLGLGEVKMHQINNGTSHTLNLLGNSAPLVDSSGKTIGSGTLEDAARSAFSGVLDFRNAVMGGELINPSQRNKVAIDGSNIVAIDLPLDMEALQRGIVRPDIDSLDRLEEAEQVIRDNNIQDEAQRNEVYKDHNLPYKYVNGQINTSAYGRFAVIDAAAHESAFLEDASLDDHVEHILDANQRASIEQILKAADKDFKMSNSDFLGWGEGDVVYGGSVYIPIRQNIINASLGSGKYATLQGNDANKLQAEEDRKIKLQNYVPSPSLSTLQN